MKKSTVIRPVSQKAYSRFVERINLVISDYVRCESMLAALDTYLDGNRDAYDCGLTHDCVLVFEMLRFDIDLAINRSAQARMRARKRKESKADGQKQAEEQDPSEGLKPAEEQESSEGLKPAEEQESSEGLKAAEEQESSEGLKPSEVEELSLADELKSSDGLKSFEGLKPSNGNVGEQCVTDLPAMLQEPIGKHSVEQESEISTSQEPDSDGGEGDEKPFDGGDDKKPFIVHKKRRQRCAKSRRSRSKARWNKQ